MMVLPVLVTVEPARTPKLCAVPSGGAVAIASAESGCANKRSAANPMAARTLKDLLFILFILNVSSS
jgi:hypothetical protein